jgi:protein-S-isoprenylcysteine O-methyltransferase Ste14
MRVLDWPPIWLLGCLAAAWGLSWAVPLGLFGAAGAWAGWGLIVAGLALMGLAVLEMVRARTTVIPRRTASRLVTSGVFRLSRNPIYLGDALVLLGACLIFNSALGLIFVPAFIWIITKRFIEGEEAGLAREFGAEFDSWSAAVRRWV